MGAIIVPHTNALPLLIWQFGGLRSPATGKTVPRWISAGRDSDDRRKLFNRALHLKTGAPLTQKIRAYVYKNQTFCYLGTSTVYPKISDGIHLDMAGG